MSDTRTGAKHVKPAMSNEMYDFLKKVAQYWLPALGALYFGLAQIWGLPNAEQVVGTVAVVDTFLGVVLGYSSQKYNQSDAKFDGALLVDVSDEARDVYTFEVTEPLETLKDKQVLTIRVDKLDFN